MANRIWDFWANNYRNARALGAAFSMLLAILAMSLLRCNPLVETVNIPGVVIRVEAEGLHPFGENEAYSRVIVSTPDSTKVRLLVGPPVPVIGNVIPVIEEQYKKGDSRYAVDLLKWKMDGPQ